MEHKKEKKFKMKTKTILFIMWIVATIIYFASHYKSEDYIRAFVMSIVLGIALLLYN